MADHWADDAACRPGQKHWGRVVDPEWWFPQPGRTGGRWALTICQTICPVEVECLAYATRNELAGIWGGRREIERYGHYVTHKPGEGEE